MKIGVGKPGATGTGGAAGPLPIGPRSGAFLALVLMAWIGWATRRSFALNGPLWDLCRSSLASLPFAPPGWSGAAEAVVRHLALIGSAVLQLVSAFGLGGVMIRWLVPRRSGDAAVVLAAPLVGLWLTGTALLALALIGLLFRPVVLLVALLGCAAPGLWRDAPRAAARATGWIRSRAPATVWWVVPALLPVVAVALVAMVPDAHVDTYVYHLGIPEQFLKAHKFTAEWTSIAHHYPLAGELTYLPAIVLGLDALPHLLNLAAFGLALAVAGRWATRVAGSPAGWLVGALGLTFGLVGQLAVVAKNDLLAAAYPVVGMLFLLGGGARPARTDFLLSALSLGCGAAMKLNGWALLGVATLVAAGLRPGWRSSLLWLAVAAAPFACWPLKAWLMMGDPLWPLFAARLPGAIWDPRSAPAIAIMRGADPGLRAAGRQLLDGIAGHAPGLAVLVPLSLLAVTRTTRAERWLWLFNGLALLGLVRAIPSEWFRLALPVFVLLLVAASAAGARVIRSLPGAGRRGVLGLLGLSCLAPACLCVEQDLNLHLCEGYLTGALPPARFLAERRTTLTETAATLAAQRDVRGVFGIAESRFYRMPGRILSLDCWGKSCGWEAAHRCRDADGIRKWFRQAGCRHLILNVVAEGYPHAFESPFGWDDRSLRAWVAFVSRYLDVAAPPAHVDNVNGGFYLYEIRTTPRPAAARYLPNLPGIESLYYGITSQRDVRRWVAAGLALDARVPGVAFIRNRIAKGYAIAGDWPKAYAAYAFGVRHGMIDGFNYYGMAVAAANTGRFAEAKALLRRSAEIQLGTAADVDRVLRQVEAAERASARR